MSPLPRCLVTVIAALCAVGVASCGSTGDSAKNASTASKPATPPPTKSAPAPTPKPKLAPLGTTFTVQAGSGSGPNRPTTQLKVRATRLINRINGNFFQRGALQRGNRFVGVQLSLTNVDAVPGAGHPVISRHSSRPPTRRPRMAIRRGAAAPRLPRRRSFPRRASARLRGLHRRAW